MKQVDVPMSRLLELRDDPKVKASGKSVQVFLVEWCLEFFGEEPICTRLVAPNPDGLGLFNNVTTGMAFEFRDPKNAMTFKLTWGGI